jgi:hypothetical protein
MTYTVRRFENTYSATDKIDTNVLDNTLLSTASSLTYVGRHNNNYTTAIAEDFLWLLENFASNQPPAYAVQGQLWFNTGANTFYIYEGADPDKGGNSTILTDWHPITLDTASGIASHEALTGYADPHRVTVSQVGLSNVTNTISLNRSLNLSDVPNKNAARQNLDIYDKSQVYSKAEYDANFYKSTDTVSNTLLLVNKGSSSFVPTSASVVNNGIIGNNINNNDFIIANNVMTHLNTGSGAALSFISGGNSNNVIQGPGGNTSSIVRMSFLTAQSPAQWKVTERGLTTAGNSPPVVQELIFSSGGLFVNGNKVYHTGNPPTNTELGTLSASGQAANSLLLNGKLNDPNPTINTIVEVGTNGVINVADWYSYDTALSIPTATSEVLFRNSSADNIYRVMTKAKFQTWLQPAVPAFSRAWISFNGVTGAAFGADGARNCTVSKSAAGTYTVTLTDALAPALYNVVVGSLAAIPTGSTTYVPGDGKMKVLRSWTTINAPVGGLQNFTVYVKEIVNDYFSDTQADSFVSRLADTDYINVCVIY